MDQETLAMQLIVNAGNAKSLAMKAIMHAKRGEAEEANAQLQASEEAMTLAHKFQTEALQESMEHPERGVNMLMAHAQDHLMNALTTQTLAKEFLTLYDRVEELTAIVKGERV